MKQLNPVQFRVLEYWNLSRAELLRLPAVEEALLKLAGRWREVAEWKYEENSPHDEPRAKAEFELDLHIGRVKITNLHWLIEQFDNPDMIDLAEAIAQHAMPESVFQVIEKGETAVVTDSARTVVLDMKHGRDVSAGVSLFWAGDTKYQTTREELLEFQRWMKGRIAILENSVERMQNDLRVSKAECAP